MTVEPNSNWASPEEAPIGLRSQVGVNVYLQRVTVRSEDGSQDWHRVPPKLFQNLTDHTRTLLITYLRHCQEEGIRPLYMPDRDVETLCRILPFVKVVRVPGKRHHSWWSPIPISRRLLSPVRLQHWQRAAEEWQQGKQGETAMNLTELREVLYRLSLVHDGEETVEKKYLRDWLASLS